MFPTTTHVFAHALNLANYPATVPWVQGRRLCVVRYLQNTKDKSNEGFYMQTCVIIPKPPFFKEYQIHQLSYGNVNLTVHQRH